MKKAQGVQFNWIFVVVSGAILIIFFSGFGIKYAELQKNRENAEIARGIDRIINGLRGQEQYKTIDINANFKFEFNCDSFTINDNYVQNLNGKIIFTQDNLKVNKLYAWTKEFKKAYKIDNFVYLVDSNKDYYLIKDGNEEYASKIYNELPSIFTNFKTLYFDELIKSQLGKNNEFVFFSESSQDQINELKEKGDLLIIDSINNIVTFNKNEKAKVLNEALVYGAIFSGGYNTYKCGYDQLTEKFSNINNIYTKKAEYLQSCCSTGFCDYSLVKSSLLNYNIESDDNVIKLLNAQLYNSNCKVVF